jgi:hypothetical protein
MSIAVLSARQLPDNLMNRLECLEIENQVLKEILRRVGNQLSPPLDTESIFSELKRAVLVAERLSDRP